VHRERELAAKKLSAGSCVVEMRLTILALDTSTEACSVACWRWGEVLAQDYAHLGHGHAEALVPMVASVMAESGLCYGQLDAIAVTIGPGTFTGLRVGLAAEHYNRYPHEFSGGQRQRVVIARALALNPKFIICDEAVSALDVSVQAKVLNLLNELKNEFGFTYIFISHDLSVVRYMSDRIMVMKNGRVIEVNDADKIFINPQNEYTKQLIDSIPANL